jgi:hypothetical protein
LYLREGRDSGGVNRYRRTDGITVQVELHVSGEGLAAG